ncbi:MAG: thioredoxin [Actinomycetota bacterium]
MANGITDLSTATFDETIGASDKPVIVDFWAEWCGPCKKIAPILGEIAEERDDLSVSKLNVDDNSDVAMKFSVMSIPTLIVFDKGEVVGRITGAKSKAAFLEEIDGFLGTSH